MKENILEFEEKKSITGSPNPVDVHVGKRIRLRRTLLGYSQQLMARKLGLTFQQLQKYEKGHNRVGASRLWDISRILKVPMDFFFQEMDKEIENNSPMMQVMSGGEDAFMFSQDCDTIDLDPMKKQETIELVSAYYKISNRALAKQVFDLVISLSKTSSKFADE